MECTGCGFANPEAMKFCGQCGKSLASGWPQCGLENPQSIRFCGECGGQLQVRGSGCRVQGSGHSTNLTTNGLTTSNLSPSPRTSTPKHLAEKALRSKSAVEAERKQSAEKIGSVLGRVGPYGYSGAAYALGKEWQSARDSLELARERGRANQPGGFLDAYYQEWLRDAHRLFREMGATGHAERVAPLLEEASR